MNRRNFLKTSIAGTGIVALSSCSKAFGYFDNTEHQIIKQSIKIKNLPVEFKNCTIALISDIHSQDTMTKTMMSQYAKIVNSLNSDLIFVTGDFVNRKLDEVYPFAEAFSILKAPLGVFGCLGNHDYFTGKVEEVSKEVDDCGIKLLRNDFIKITKGNSFINLIGVDDIGWKFDKHTKPKLDDTISNVKNDEPKILLCHRPNYLEDFSRLKIDLTLSGHTHGGQIVLIEDMNWLSLAGIVTPYVAGLYKMENSQLYVNRGIGTVGPSLRINCLPEVTLITLEKS